MCELAIDHKNHVPTAKGLDDFKHEINEVLGGAQRVDGSRVPCYVFLLAGSWFEGQS